MFKPLKEVIVHRAIHQIYRICPTWQCRSVHPREITSSATAITNDSQIRLATGHLFGLVTHRRIVGV